MLLVSLALMKTNCYFLFTIISFYYYYYYYSKNTTYFNCYTICFK